jgi:hypothetical protein
MSPKIRCGSQEEAGYDGDKKENPIECMMPSFG